MRSIKFDQLERRGQAVPAAIAPPPPLAAGSLSFRAADVLADVVGASDAPVVTTAAGGAPTATTAKGPDGPLAGSGKS